MHVYVLELFKNGIGPSSSHTVGPMKARKHPAKSWPNSGWMKLSGGTWEPLRGSWADLMNSASAVRCNEGAVFCLAQWLLTQRAMFGLFKKKTPPPPPAPHPLRETFFGDLALENWPASPGADEPEFAKDLAAARAALAEDRKADAVAALARVASAPGLESRITLMAWFHLSKLGVQPPADSAKAVHGAVLEVWMKDGLDILAAYRDGSARYVNYSGKVLIWDAPGVDAEIDAALESLLAAGQQVAERIGPWEGGMARPLPPPYGHVRLNMLTPSGIHFGQGLFEQLMGDPMGAALLQSGSTLMRLLTEKKFD